MFQYLIFFYKDSSSHCILFYMQGCHSFFQNFFQAFKISSRFLMICIFRLFFSLNLSLRLKLYYIVKKHRKDTVKLL